MISNVETKKHNTHRHDVKNKNKNHLSQEHNAHKCDVKCEIETTSPKNIMLVNIM
jgi:hypothetical protein